MFIKGKAETIRIGNIVDKTEQQKPPFHWLLLDYFIAHTMSPHNNRLKEWVPWIECCIDNSCNRSLTVTDSTEKKNPFVFAKRKDAVSVPSSH